MRRRLLPLGEVCLVSGSLHVHIRHLNLAALADGLKLEVRGKISIPGASVETLAGTHVEGRVVRKRSVQSVSNREVDGDLEEIVL